ncbi:sigma-70 family RNA polymerase sigma factor [Paenibacillus zeisoli]|uniref:Sigma-70 family RNA polymerase sigma factor n=1 Tax=Paenibacillus zeisoli TaxID=2496267 RepID=A0A433XD55_9BACL|nr:sigma-70 family RNA polymerase sigma factor [Paenibacillus zeisoli]RUT31960.1 sigma-70 family RNA polymerase sigma factor [Paenibacillus zeisoli]
MQERQWAADACKGDEIAFHELINSQKRKLYGIAYSYLRNEADALEVLQETVCRAWMKCGKLKDPDTFIPWLYRILMNCCVDELRRRRRVDVISQEPQQGTIEMVDVNKLDIERVLNRMKPKYRHALMLKYYQDMTVPEIARILEKPEGTIKTWIHQGLKQLRGQIEQGGGWDHE